MQKIEMISVMEVGFNLRKTPLSRSIQILKFLSLFGIILAITFISLGLFSSDGYSTNIFLFIFIRYGLWSLLAVLILLLVVRWKLPDWFNAELSSHLELKPKHILLMALAVIPLIGMGHFVVMHAYPFSSDEFMVKYQAELFAQGHLTDDTSSLPQEMVFAMKEINVLSDAEGGNWASSYLPLASMVLSLFELLGVPWLLSPLLVAGSILMMGRLLLREYKPPSSRSWSFVALVTFALSPQLLLTGMTYYAMNLHLFITVLWLSCYRSDDLILRGATPWIGVLGLGVHQPFLHASFVIPFSSQNEID